MMNQSIAFLSLIGILTLLTELSAQTIVPTQSDDIIMDAGTPGKRTPETVSGTR